MCYDFFFQENSCQPSPPSLLSHKWRSLMEKLVVLKVKGNIKQNKTKKKKTHGLESYILQSSSMLLPILISIYNFEMCFIA